MFIYFLKILFWFILFIFGIAIFEVLWRLIIAFWKLYKTKFPFAKGFIPFLEHLPLIQSGKCPFVFSNLSTEKTVCAFRGSHPCLITSDPKLIKQICIKYSHHFHSRMIDPLSPNPYHSPFVHVFGARGQRWKRIRTVTSQTLSTAKLRSMLPLILEQTDDFIIYLTNYLLNQNLITYSPTAEVDIHFLFQQLTAAVIGRCALGLGKNKFENPPKHFEFFKQVFGPEPKIAMDFETFQWILPTITNIVASLTAIWAFKTPIDKLNDFIRELLNKQIQDNSDTDILKNLKEFETFEHNYLKTEKNDRGISNLDDAISNSDKIYTEEIISTIRFLSIAGFDTTANTLSFACLLLAENPKKLQKVFEEIDSLNDKNLDYDILTKAIYVNAVLLETLRLFPHASMLQSRLTLTDCKIDDKILIPSGVGILFDTWSLHHDPNFWGQDVEEFKPERHLSTNTFSDHFIPFGVGPRQCIGMRFALMEQKAVLIQFFKNFTVKLPPGMTSKNVYISLRNTGTIWPKNLRLIIEKRTHFPNPA